MKKMGIMILSIGLLFTVLTTSSLLMKERITDPIKIKTAHRKIQQQIWKPLFGAIVVMVGAGVYFVGRKGNTLSS